MVNESINQEKKNYLVHLTTLHRNPNRNNPLSSQQCSAEEVTGAQEWSIWDEGHGGASSS